MFKKKIFSLLLIAILAISIVGNVSANSVRIKSHVDPSIHGGHAVSTITYYSGYWTDHEIKTVDIGHNVDLNDYIPLKIDGIFVHSIRFHTYIGWDVALCTLVNETNENNNYDFVVEMYCKKKLGGLFYVYQISCNGVHGNTDYDMRTLFLNFDNGSVSDRPFKN